MRKWCGTVVTNGRERIGLMDPMWRIAWVLTFIGGIALIVLTQFGPLESYDGPWLVWWATWVVVQMGGTASADRNERARPIATNGVGVSLLRPTSTSSPVHDDPRQSDRDWFLVVVRPSGAEIGRKRIGPSTRAAEKYRLRMVERIQTMGSGDVSDEEILDLLSWRPPVENQAGTGGCTIPS